MHPGPAAAYSRDGHVITNVNQEFQEALTTGQRVADAVARVVGSWPFILFQSAIIAVWLAVNGYLVCQAVVNPAYFHAWDPYPFILLNLVLSFQAAYTGPIVLMSQNRLSEKDRLMAEQDYHLNLASAKEIRIIMEHLAHQDEFVLAGFARLEKMFQSGGLKGKGV